MKNRLTERPNMAETKRTTRHTQVSTHTIDAAPGATHKLRNTSVPTICCGHLRLQLAIQCTLHRRPDAGSDTLEWRCRVGCDGRTEQVAELRELVE